MLFLYTRCESIAQVNQSESRAQRRESKKYNEWKRKNVPYVLIDQDNGDVLALAKLLEGILNSRQWRFYQRAKKDDGDELVSSSYLQRLDSRTKKRE